LRPLSRTRYAIPTLPPAPFEVPLTSFRAILSDQSRWVGAVVP